MKPHRENKLLNLAAHQLPGPDTETKLEALKCADSRMQLMLAESCRIGWPRGFANDLYLHDLETLANHPGQRMVWILRENGTHLYPTHCATSGEAAYYRRVIEYWSGEDKLNFTPPMEARARFYLLANDALGSITWQQARDALVIDEASRKSQP